MWPYLPCALLRPCSTRTRGTTAGRCPKRGTMCQLQRCRPHRSWFRYALAGESAADRHEEVLRVAWHINSETFVNN
eukprot:1674204-Pyramimonas_sp.AAC.1